MHAGQFLIAATEPSCDMKNQRNCHQYEYEVDKRYYYYFGRMVLYPFPPRQQSCSRNSGEESPLGGHPSPEAFVRSASDVPKQMADNPTGGFPINRLGHVGSVTPLAG
jgi:hypothetical protein